MSRVPSQGHPNDAEVVRAAAKQSLAAHGVRLHRVRIMETDGAWTDPWSWEIGVADPAARSVQLRHFTAEDSPVEKFAEAVARKWPWLVDDTPPTEPGPRAGQETIEIDRGLVGRIAWSPTTGKRFNPGLLLRLAMLLAPSPAPEPAVDGEGRLWNVTEFCDFGCSVEISAPTNLIDRRDTSMRDIVRGLWRMRRQYTRAHRPSDLLDRASQDEDHAAGLDWKPISTWAGQWRGSPDREPLRAPRPSRRRKGRAPIAA